MTIIRIKHLILMIMTLCAITATSHDFEVDGIYYNITGNTVAVTFKGTSYSEYSDEYIGIVIIPASVTYNGITYPVTTIGESAFHGCSLLESIKIPNSVSTIEFSAFGSCKQLTYVELPNSITHIKQSAFHSCTGLKSIIIPNSVINIGSYAFCLCTGLTNVEIPNSVTYMGTSAFAGCDGLTSVRIPNSVINMGTNPFGSCIRLESIIVEQENQNYDSRNNCNAIIDTRTNTIVSGCQNTIIPNTVTTIGNSAFGNCPGLTNIEIPNSVSSIGILAFDLCSGLTSVNIPSSVSSIDFHAFGQCGNLADIYCYAAIPPTCNDDIVSGYSKTLHVPASSLAAYFIAPYWCNFENIIGDAVAPVGIDINKDSIELQLDNQFQLVATVTPLDASNIVITWRSTDTNIAVVNNGLVIATGYGECDIIASCFGMQTKCHVSVVNRISLNQQVAMLLPNHMLTLTPSALAMPDGFTVTSSDPTVAAARVMNGKVQVVGIKEGATTITVGSADGTAIPATCLVTVYTELGDLNCDGFINISDVTQIIDYLLSGDASNIKLENADVNADSNINISDVTTLIDKLLSSN